MAAIAGLTRLIKFSPSRAHSMKGSPLETLLFNASVDKPICHEFLSEVLELPCLIVLNTECSVFDAVYVPHMNDAVNPD